MEQIKYTKSDLYKILTHFGVVYKKSMKKSVLMDLFTSIDLADLYKGFRTMDSSISKWNSHHYLRGFYHPIKTSDTKYGWRLTDEIGKIYSHIWGFINLLKQFRPDVQSWENVEIVTHLLVHTHSSVEFSDEDPIYRCLQGQSLTEAFVPRLLEDLCDDIMDHKYFMDMFDPFTVRADGQYVLDVKEKLGIEVSEEEVRRSKLVSLLSSLNLEDVKQGMMLLEALYGSIEEICTFFNVDYNHKLPPLKQFLGSQDVETEIATYQYYWLLGYDYTQYPNKYKLLSELRITGVSEQFQLPDTMRTMDRFETIYWQNNPVELPEWIFSWKNLQKMEINSTPEVPEGTSFEQSKIATINISDVDMVPDWIWKLPKLKLLDATGAKLMYFQPKTVSNVETLLLGFSSRSRYSRPNSSNFIFNNLPAVKVVKALNLQEWTATLPSLETLTLNGLEVFAPTVKSTALQNLTINLCKYSETQVDLSTCVALKSLNIYLPKDFGKDQALYPIQGMDSGLPIHLESLTLDVPRDDFSIPNLHRLDSLTTLSLTKCANPENLGDCAGWRNLKTVSLNQVKEVTKEWVQSVPLLEKLEVSKCYGSKTVVVAELNELTNLTSLKLDSVDVLALPSSLKSLEVTNLSHQAKLWSFLPTVTSLESVKLDNHERQCSEELLQCVGLKYLKMRLGKIPQDISALINLETLIFEVYPSPELPKGIDALQNLKILYFGNDKQNFTRFPNEFLALPNLEYLHFHMDCREEEYPLDAYKILGKPYILNGRVYWPRNECVRSYVLQYQSLYEYARTYPTTFPLSHLYIGDVMFRTNVQCLFESFDWSVFSNLLYLDLSQTPTDLRWDIDKIHSYISLPHFIRRIKTVTDINMSFSKLMMPEWLFDMPNLSTIVYVGCTFTDAEKNRLQAVAKKSGINIHWNV